MLDLIQDGDTREIADTALPGVVNGDPDVFYTVRKLEPEQHRKIVKKHTRKEFERGIGKVEHVDHAAAADDILDYVLTGWRGILLKGAPAPCTREWKLKGLDFTRRSALIDLAGMNEIAREPERRAESFRAAD